MSAKTLYLFIAAAVIAVGAVIGLRAWEQPKSESEQAKPLLPSLRDHVDDVSGVKLTGAGGKIIATLTRDKAGWTIAERSGYPADLSYLRDYLIKLDQATLLEAKTDSPKRYADIGVEDVKDERANGVLVELTGLSAPVALIVGNYSTTSRATFVRRDGEATSWLVSGFLTPPKTTAEWEKRDLIDIAPNRVTSIVLRAPDGKALRMSKAQPSDPNFNVADVPKGREVNQAVAALISGALADLEIEDVLPAKDQPAPKQAYKAQYVTFDGLIIHAAAWASDRKGYVQLSASLDQALASTWIKQVHDKAQPTADNAAAKLAAANKYADVLNNAIYGWTFVVPVNIVNNMSNSMSEVLKPLDVKRVGEVDAKPAKVSADTTFAPKPR
jgi:Domain of unknown function (DUF4340)